MVKKLLFSMVVMVVGIGFVAGTEYTCTITKVEDGKVTLQKMKKAAVKGQAPEKDGEPFTLTVAKDVKVHKATGAKGKFTEGDAIEGGLAAEQFKKIGEKGIVGARIFTEGEGKEEKVTKIYIVGKKAAN